MSLLIDTFLLFFGATFGIFLAVFIVAMLVALVVLFFLDWAAKPSDDEESGS